MGEIILNDLPLKFPGRNTAAFPNPWPDRDLPGKGKTPKRKSAQWKAIIDFKESKDWQSVRVKNFIEVDGEFHRNFFAHKQLHFVLLMLFKDTDKSPFTQLFVLM